MNSLEQAIELIRKKSPREGKVFQARLPLLPAARRILEKYNGQLPVISNQRYNPYLKAIGQVLQLDFKLTSHIARKSFCTILFNAGLSVEMIGEWVGHSTAKTTLATYIRGQVGEMEKRVVVLGFGT